MISQNEPARKLQGPDSMREQSSSSRVHNETMKQGEEKDYLLPERQAMSLDGDRAMVQQLQESIRQIKRGTFDLDKRKSDLLAKLHQVKQKKSKQPPSAKKSKLSIAGLMKRFGKGAR